MFHFQPKCDDMLVVYVLYAEMYGKYYVGQTNNIERRLIEHNMGASKFTSKYKPWTLVWT
jgi:putative endonuclease